MVNLNTELIKEVLTTMEYGSIMENVDLAKKWFKENNEIYDSATNKLDKDAGNKTEIRDVNTDEELGIIFSPDVASLKKILLDASKKTDEWQKLKQIERAKILDRFADEISKNSDLISQIEVCARGILSKDTKNDAVPMLVEYLKYYSSFAAINGIQNSSDVSVSLFPEETHLALLGVAIGPALAAGKKVLLQTKGRLSFVGFLLVQLSLKIGIPRGTLRIIPGDVDIQTIFDHNNVTHISIYDSIFKQEYNFSNALSQHLTVYPFGTIPMLVFSDADLYSACNSVIQLAWEYNTSKPWSVRTVIVQEDIFEEFINKLKFRLSKLKVGNSNNKLADIAYPINKNTINAFFKTINDAKCQGIEVYQYGNSEGSYSPTLLIGGRVYDNNVISEDTPSPVVTIVGFRTINEGIALANNSRYGLGTVIWTENIGVAKEVQRKLKVSNVWINTNVVFSAEIPISCYKNSAKGYFGGHAGMDEYFKSKTEERIEIESFQNVNFTDIMNNAKQSQEAWQKVSPYLRSQKIRNIAELTDLTNISKTLWDLTESQVHKTILEMSSVPGSTKNNHDTTCYREPVGVLLIVTANSLESTLIGFILTALLAGNSVIMLFHNTKDMNFYIALSKHLPSCGITNGVLVVLEYDKNIMKQAVLNKNVKRCFSVHPDDNFTLLPLKYSLKDYTIVTGSYGFQKILNDVTNIKTVWSSIGQSFV